MARVRILVVLLAGCYAGSPVVPCTLTCDPTAPTPSCPAGLTCGSNGLCKGPGFSCAPPLSCEGLAETCGPTGTSSCCESLRVPGATFYRGYDVAADSVHKTRSYPATVGDFLLDEHEVTVGRFRKFVDAGQGTQATPPASGAGAHSNLPSSGWDPTWNDLLARDRDALLADMAVTCDPTSPIVTFTEAPGGNESRPVNCVTWYEAMAFCVWDGGYLPTEAERHFAASGGVEQRAYPWSDPPGDVVVDGTRPSYQCMGDGLNGCAVTDLLVVGTNQAGQGRWGHSDLGGNVWEWTLDGFAAFDPALCDNCANLSSTVERVQVGGGFDTEVVYMRAAYRLEYRPSFATRIPGFVVPGVREPTGQLVAMKMPPAADGRPVVWSGHARGSKEVVDTGN